MAGVLGLITDFAAKAGKSIAVSAGNDLLSRSGPAGQGIVKAYSGASTGASSSTSQAKLTQAVNSQTQAKTITGTNVISGLNIINKQMTLGLNSINQSIAASAFLNQSLQQQIIKQLVNLNTMLPSIGNNGSGYNPNNNNNNSSGGITDWFKKGAGALSLGKLGLGMSPIGRAAMLATTMAENMPDVKMTTPQQRSMAKLLQFSGMNNDKISDTVFKDAGSKSQSSTSAKDVEVKSDNLIYKASIIKFDGPVVFSGGVSGISGGGSKGSGSGGSGSGDSAGGPGNGQGGSNQNGSGEGGTNSGGFDNTSGKGSNHRNGRGGSSDDNSSNNEGNVRTFQPPKGFYQKDNYNAPSIGSQSVPSGLSAFGINGVGNRDVLGKIPNGIGGSVGGLPAFYTQGGKLGIQFQSNKFSGPSNERLAKERAPFFEHLDKNPELKRLIIQAALSEGGRKSLQNNIEQMANYGNVFGKHNFNEILHSGQYGPVNRGQAQIRELSKKDIEAGEAALDAVRKGSNNIDYRSDQGLPSDPGAKRYLRMPDKNGYIHIDGNDFYYHGSQGKTWAADERKADREYENQKGNGAKLSYSNESASGPNFLTEKSRKELAGVNKELAENFIEASKRSGIQFQVTQGWRSQKEADRNAKSGKGVSDSQHKYHAAADLAMIDPVTGKPSMDRSLYEKFGKSFNEIAKEQGTSQRWLGSLPGRWGRDYVHFDQGLGYGQTHKPNPYGYQKLTAPEIQQAAMITTMGNPFRPFVSSPIAATLPENNSLKSDKNYDADGNPKTSKSPYGDLSASNVFKNPYGDLSGSNVFKDSNPYGDLSGSNVFKDSDSAAKKTQDMVDKSIENTKKDDSSDKNVNVNNNVNNSGGKSDTNDKTIIEPWQPNFEKYWNTI